MPQPERTRAGPGKAPDGAVVAVGDIQVAARIERERIGRAHTGRSRQPLGTAVPSDSPDAASGVVLHSERRVDIAPVIDRKPNHTAVELMHAAGIQHREHGLAVISGDRTDFGDPLVADAMPVAEVDRSLRIDRNAFQQVRAPGQVNQLVHRARRQVAQQPRVAGKSRRLRSHSGLVRTGDGGQQGRNDGQRGDSHGCSRVGEAWNLTEPGSGLSTFDHRRVNRRGRW